MFFIVLFFLVIPSSVCADNSNIFHRVADTIQIVSAVNGHEYELYIKLPNNYQRTSKTYPVAVLQDVGVTLAATEDAVSLMAGRQIEDVILVGMSYSKDVTPKISRTRDFTPTYAPNETGAHSLEAQKYSGNAKEYMEFIERQVLPLLSQKYRINKNKKIFIGHSFGGLLGTYILLNNSQLFDSYIISSPSLWYDSRVIFRLEESYSKRNKNMIAKVLLHIGEEESKSRRGNMVQDLLRFEKVLKSRNYEGLDIKAVIVSGADHSSAFPLLISSALREIVPIN